MIIIIIVIIIIDSYINTVLELMYITLNGGIIYNELTFVIKTFLILVRVNCKLYDLKETHVHATVVVFKAYKQTINDCYSYLMLFN